MKVAVQGTKEFLNYDVFMRAMGVALSDVKDGEFIVYSAGPVNVNNFASEFCNMSERNLKARGIKVKLIKVPASYIQEHMKDFNYFAFLSTPNQKPSSLASYADLSGVETGIFRY